MYLGVNTKKIDFHKPDSVKDYHSPWLHVTIQLFAHYPSPYNTIHRTLFVIAAPRDWSSQPNLIGSFLSSNPHLSVDRCYLLGCVAQSGLSSP